MQFDAIISQKFHIHPKGGNFKYLCVSSSDTRERIIIYMFRMDENDNFTCYYSKEVYSFEYIAHPLMLKDVKTKRRTSNGAIFIGVSRAD